MACQKLYQIICQVSGKPSILCDCVGDVNESIKTTRWCEHFEHFLKFGEQSITLTFSSAAEFYPSPADAVSCKLLPKEEIADALQNPRDNKASREDGIHI
ncbi:unnamed protein product [Dibothriocephalus latus]|uniref:Uncharacterized protein n=1 Tax=Dibothriocephalus latus TaxID=60516 RepID=A0A3P7LBL6_DIBLA|nr:unnamed protein product [Dibothriocephalus latus]